MYDRSKANVNKRGEDRVPGNGCESTGTWDKEESLEEENVEPIAMIMRRLEWSGHVKRR